MNLQVWKDRLRRHGPKVVYPIFYLLCFLVFFSFTFPYDKLKERLVTQFNAQQRTSSHPQVLEIDELDSSFITGVKMKGVRLVTPPAAEGKAPSVIAIDEARARISLLSRIFGTTDVSFKIDAFDGVVKGSYEESSKQREIDVNFDGVDLARVSAIAENIGFPLDGKLHGEVRLQLPEGKASKANGTVNLEVRDLWAGNTKELQVKTPMGPFTLPRLKVGTVNITGDAKEGVLKLTKIAATGGDVDVSGDGRIQLRENATDAHLDVPLKFKLNDAYRNKNDKTKLLFGTPGSKEKPMIEMDPKMGRAKTPDGYYQLKVGGTLAKPDPQPGGGGSRMPEASPFTK